MTVRFGDYDTKSGSFRHNVPIVRNVETLRTIMNNMFCSNSSMCSRGIADALR